MQKRISHLARNGVLAAIAVSAAATMAACSSASTDSANQFINAVNDAQQKVVNVVEAKNGTQLKTQIEANMPLLTSDLSQMKAAQPYVPDNLKNIAATCISGLSSMADSLNSMETDVQAGNFDSASTANSNLQTTAKTFSSNCIDAWNNAVKN